MMSFYFNKLVDIFPFFLSGLWMTVKVGFLSLIICTVLGFILGMIRTGHSVIPRRIVGAYVAFARGTPFVVQIFIVFLSFLNGDCSLILFLQHLWQWRLWARLLSAKLLPAG